MKNSRRGSKASARPSKSRSTTRTLCAPNWRISETPLLRLPAFRGRRIRLRFETDLTAWRGRLLSGGDHGAPVHAGSFLRSRSMVLDSALRGKPRELARILAHELFHFAWLRLGNPRRRRWEQVLLREMAAGARGELGWSSEQRKQVLAPADRRHRTRRWREYLCESFCDTGAWLAGRERMHAEVTLGRRWRQARASAWTAIVPERPAI